MSLIAATYSQLAAIQLRGKDYHSKALQLGLPATVTPFHQDPSGVPPLHTREQAREVQQAHPMSGTVPRPSRRTNDVQEGVDTGRADSGITGQESGSGGARLTNYYRPTRRGSPRPSPHNDFDINEHLPWMIVLLLLLMLVVIVVCSVKQSSRVMKKGPMQDPSSIIEKAIQRKPPAPQTHVKEKWVYYSNGQGKQILSSVFIIKKITVRFCTPGFDICNIF